MKKVKFSRIDNNDDDDDLIGEENVSINAPTSSSILASSYHQNVYKCLALFFFIFSIITGSFAFHERRQRMKSTDSEVDEELNVAICINKITEAGYQIQQPTTTPTMDPSNNRTPIPSISPTLDPTHYPTLESSNPSVEPTKCPTCNPSKTPSNSPTIYPSKIPTLYPTTLPTGGPSKTPSKPPTLSKKSEPSLANSTPLNTASIQSSSNFSIRNPTCPDELQSRITQCDNESKHALIYQCKDDGCGGIGDRYKGWANLRLLALDLCVPFQTNWDGIDQIWENKRPIQKYKEGDNSGLYNGVSHMEFYTNISFQKDILSQLSDKNLRVKSNIGITMIDHRLSKLDWVDLSDDQVTLVEGCVFHDHFKYSQPFQQRLDKELQLLHEAKKGYEHLIGIHFRMGDSMSDMREWGRRKLQPDKRAAIEQADEMIKCAYDLEMQLFESSSNALFLFVSDSEAAKDRVKKTYDNVYVTSVQPHHVERRNMISEESYRAAQLSSWTEIVIMSYTDAMVISSGGFAHVAISIGGIPKERVHKCKLACTGTTFHACDES